ncbi:protein kinase domain-containing protein [Thalassotalea fusca]
MSRPEDQNDSSNSDDSLNETQELSLAPSFEPGDYLAERFQIQDFQGSGRFGTVYRAIDKQLNSQVAIKVLNTALSQHIEAINSFKRELLLVRQLTHPNIIRVHEYYQHGDIHFITMDWIEGQSLESALADNELMPNQRINIIRQLLDAVEYAESMGVTHGDIKPDNILLDKTGNLYVADFGLSVLSTSDANRSISATPYYAPPEYLQTGKINTTTDLYAIGVIAYQLCCLHYPFSGQTITELIGNKSLSKLKFKPYLAELSWLDSWCVALLSPYPEARPQNAKQAIEAFVSSQKNATQSNNKLTSFALLSSIVVIFVFVSIWFFESESPIKRKEHYAIAVLPTVKDESQFDNHFASYLSHQLTDVSSLRVINHERIQQLIKQLGIKLPASEPKLELLADLLKVDVLVEIDKVTSGSEQIEVHYDLLFIDGFNIKRESFLNVDFDSQQWQNVTTPFISKFKAKLNVTEEPELNLSGGQSTLKALTPIKSKMANGEFLLAQEMLSELLRELPENPHVWLQQGELHLSQNNIIEAEQAYSKALSLSVPNSYSELFANARLNDIAGKIDQAQEDYLALVNTFPYNIELKIMLADFYMLIEQHKEMESILKQVAAIDPNHPNVWFMLGKAAFLQGNFDIALNEYFVRALVTAKKLKNIYQKGEALNALGVVYGQQGEVQLAFDYYQQALEVRQKAGNLAGAATTMTNLAAMHLSIGEYSKSSEYLTQSLEIYQMLNDQEGLSNSYNELGVLAEEQALYQQALEYYRKALNIRINLNHQMLQAESMNNIGFMYFMLQDTEHALVYWRQSEQLYQQVQFPLGIVHVRQSLGQMELAKGNWRNAFHLFNNTLNDAEKLGSIEESIVSKSYLAKLGFLQGNFKQSIADLILVYEKAQSIQDVRAMAEFGLWLADWSIQIGDKQQAQRFLHDINDVLTEYSNQEYKTRFNYLKQAIENNYQTLTDNNQKTDIAHDALLISQLIRQSRAALQSDERDISSYLGLLEQVDFTLHQYLYVEYLELKGIQHFLASDWQNLQQTLRQAELLMRKMGGYWRGFQFDRLRAQLAIANQQPSDKYQTMIIQKVSGLVDNLPQEKRSLFLKEQNYYPLNDAITEYIDSER